MINLDCRGRFPGKKKNLKLLRRFICGRRASCLRLTGVCHVWRSCDRQTVRPGRVGWRKQIKGRLIYECGVCVCDSRDAWLFWRLTGLGGAGVVCVNQQQYLFVLGKKSAELPFVSPIDRLFHNGGIHKSVSEWKRACYFADCTMAAHRNDCVSERRVCFH